MKRLYIPLSLVIILAWAAVQSATVLQLSAPFLEMRRALVILSGALALGWMAYSMLLAARPAWLERTLGGLDKLYQEHKWVGIGSVTWVAMHWLIELSPRTLVAWGWVTLPARVHGQRPQLDPLIALARQVAEPAAILMIALGIVAMLRFVPYSWFRKLHKLFPVTFVMGAYHSVMLFPNNPLASPLGILCIAFAILGSLIAVLSLTGQIGRRHRVAGTVSVVAEQDNGVVDLYVQPKDAWPGHRHGQFALLTLDRREGPHPFTIASDWTPGGELRFTIKPLGDYTKRLATSVNPGDRVWIEGPYGRFDFGAVDEPQVWVAGGIGLAPFLARLEALAARGGATQPIVLFYSVHTAADAAFPDDLVDLCKRARVDLVMRVCNEDGRFEDADIAKHLGPAASVWFCGPAAWGKALRTALTRKYGLAKHAFHQEAFHFR